MCKVTQCSLLLSQHHNLTQFVTIDAHRTKHAGCRRHYKDRMVHITTDCLTRMSTLGSQEKTQQVYSGEACWYPAGLFVCLCSSAHINLSLSAAIK